MEIQVGFAAVSLPLVAVILVSTRWLVMTEHAFPRKLYPLTHSDCFRGCLAGAAVGVLWTICDLLWFILWDRPGWHPGVWLVRLAMFAAFVFAGRLTLSELFRAVRLRNGHSQ